MRPYVFGSGSVYTEYVHLVKYVSGPLRPLLCPRGSQALTSAPPPDTPVRRRRYAPVSRLLYFAIVGLDESPGEMSLLQRPTVNLQTDNPAAFIEGGVALNA